MISIRRSSERGHFDFGWLDTYHTFSFGDYFDPKHSGLSVLRVINEDRVQPATGFPTHSHRNMEIITYVLEGQVEHRDSMGNLGHIRPGDVQRMSAGSGVTHSEYNASETEALHLLQIWILPDKEGIVPSYEQKNFPEKNRLNRWLLVASHDGEQGSVAIQQDAKIFVAHLNSSKLTYTLQKSRCAWLQVARGEMTLDQHQLSAGDGASIRGEMALNAAASDSAEILLFDLPDVR
jgi:quercetin 2,3-dioxygenase